MLLGVLLMTSCDKKLVVLDAPDFDVTTTAATYKAGQEVLFNFTGNAHVVSFYSGETLKDYDFIAGRVIDVKGAGATMEFTSSVQYGVQTNQVTVLASTDFNGDYSTLAKVKAATWLDITGRFKLGTTATFLAAGKIDISDLAVTGKPIYIAFKYVTKPQATNGIVRWWYIQGFAVKSKATLVNTASATPIALTLADQNSAGFRIIDQNPAVLLPAVSAPALSQVTATRITLIGNNYLYATLPAYDSTNPIYDATNPIYDPLSPAYQPLAKLPVFVPFDPASPFNDPASENWAVSTAINLETVDLGPDWSTAVKVGIAAAPLTNYRYKYPNAGTFKAVFIGSNNSIDDAKVVTKEITLTITQ